MIKILAIDDHQDNLVTLKAILQDTFPDAILYTALSGSKGIELAITNDPDVILLDIVMPGMDGFEVCRRLKEDDRVSSIPVIFLTALGGDRKSRIKALEVGAEAFLSKPIEEAELIAQIKAMVIIKKYNQRQKNEKEYLNALIAERTEELEKELKERELAEERIRLLAHSLESISECVSVTDDKDIIIYVNKSFLHTYGYTNEELIGQPTSILRAPDMEFEHVRDILPETIEGGWRGEIMNRKKDGTLFPILLSTSVIKDENDSPIALQGVALDITEMWKSRQALVEAKEQAEESNNLKSAFLNNMSHEIRTPMNHIMGFASLMLEAEAEEKDAYAEIILNSSNQLLILIENVILLSRLQSEKTQLEKQVFIPAVLIDGVIKNNSSIDQMNDNTLVTVIPEDLQHLFVISDVRKIEHILSNLTSNAIKYTFQGKIELGFKVESDKMTFYVKDTGIGIPQKEQQKIFESFYRGENALSLVIGGTGLGLAIAKELVDSLNSTIEVKSELGNGSIFSFTLPFQYASESKKIDNKLLNPLKMSEIEILIADDEMINFLYLEILLKNCVKKVDHAKNGQIAIEMARNHPYDMILMDMRMPEMNGFEATKELKKNFPDTPIIALTAYASAEEMEQTRLAGCSDFIAKPIKKEILFDVIGKYCRIW